MTKDGFLLPAVGKGGVINWSYQWDCIDGGLIADALCRAIGLEPGTPLTARQFDEAFWNLFGDPNGIGPENADFLARTFGTSGTLNHDQIAGIFDRADIRTDGPITEGHIDLTVIADTNTKGFTDDAQAANYIMGFDANGDGLINQDEFTAAMESRLADGISINGDLAAMYMDFYGFNDGGGQRVLDINGVNAMLADTSLYVAPRGPDGAEGFGINLNITPIERVVRGASLDDDMLNHGELAALFQQLGLGDRDPAQMDSLLKVYGNGDVVSVDTIMGQMQTDGFLTLNPNLAAPSALNWDNIDGVLLARAVFWEVGVDPNVDGATLTPEEFDLGVDRLFNETDGQNPADARNQVEVFGTDGRLTVTEMGTAFDASAIHIDGVAGENYVRIAAHTADIPAHHHASWWKSTLKFLGDEAKDVVATISEVTGIAEETVANILNGKLSVEEALAQGGGEIVTAISAAVQRGDERAMALIDKLGEAITSGIEGLSEEAKAVVMQMVESAKAGGGEVAIRALSAMTGMPADAVLEVIESITQKGSMVDFAKNMTYEDMMAMIPDYEATLAELEAQADALMGTVGNDPTARRTLEDNGYSFDSSNNLMRSGRVLNEADQRDVFAKYFRADAGVELNMGSTGKKQAFNGLQVRFFVDYAGTDANGNKTIQFRIRVLDEAGFAVGTKSAGADGGLFSAHDLIMQWKVPPEGPPVKGDVLYNSTLGVIGEVNGGAGGLANFLGTTVQGSPVQLPAAWNEADIAAGNQADTEVGIGWGKTVSYNLSEMGDDWYQPFLSEIAGAAVGGGGTIALLLLGEVIAPEVMTEFNTI